MQVIFRFILINEIIEILQFCKYSYDKEEIRETIKESLIPKSVTVDVLNIISNGNRYNNGCSLKYFRYQLLNENHANKKEELTFNDKFKNTTKT